GRPPARGDGNDPGRNSHTCEPRRRRHVRSPESPDQRGDELPVTASGSLDPSERREGTAQGEPGSMARAPGAGGPAECRVGRVDLAALFGRRGWMTGIGLAVVCMWALTAVTWPVLVPY